MNLELKQLAIDAGAPAEVINNLWFSIFCQQFAHLILLQCEELENDN
jgi:hypothetical protein